MKRSKSQAEVKVKKKAYRSMRPSMERVAGREKMREMTNDSRKTKVKVEVEKTVHKFDVGKRCFNRLLPIAYCPIHQYNMLRNEKR